MENLARSESGSNAYQVDIGLFDIYRQASYTCIVTCLGNVMIQPTMYFYLKNVPMFKGSYWIMDVTHSIKGNSISTSFTGVRISNSSLPNPKDSFMASYKPLFDTLTNVALNKINVKSTPTPTTEKSITVNGKNVTIDKGTKPPIENESTIKESGYLNGVPYNGYTNGDDLPETYIQYVSYQNEKWLRTTVVEMGGPNYPIDSTVSMNIISKVTDITKNPNEFTWSNIKNLSTTNEFYCTRFNLKVISPDNLTKTTTVFLNPNGKNKNREPIISQYNLDMTAGKIEVKGPVSVGPKMETKYGVGMSINLMKKLGLHDGDVVYFKFI
jgi:hypothetical protein